MQQGRALQAAFSHLRFIVADHLLETHANGPAGLPSKDLLGPSSIRSPLLGIICRNGLIDDVHATNFLSVFLLHLLDDLANKLREFTNGELITVTNVYGASLIRVHEGNHAVDEIMDVLEGSGLLAITVDGHVLTLERLDDEVGNHPTIKGVHCDGKCLQIADKCVTNSLTYCEGLSSRRHGINTIIMEDIVGVPTYHTC